MSSLSRYGQNAADRTYPDKDESVLGHMVLELGMSPEDAVQNLRPWVRDLDRSAASSKNTAYITAFIGAGAGLATAATLGIGVTAILPIAAAIYNYFIGQQSAQEQTVREAEYLLLKSCPELLKLIYALSKRGMPKEALIECYDELLGAFTFQFQQRASLGMSDELDHDIVRTFQGIVQAKIEAENLGRSIVAETQDFKFDTLYQSTEPTAPRVEDPKYQPSPNTQLGAISVPAQSAQTEDIARSLAEQFQSTLIVGQPGAGKGLTIAYATRWIKKLHPDCQIWAIDPKSDPSEADYWTACDRVLNCPIRPFTPAEDMEAIQEQIDAFIAEFQGSHAPMKLLIFDEALAVKEKTGKWFKGLMAGFNALCSMGRSSKQYGWLVSQSPNTDDFGISGGTRNVYRRVLLLARSNLGLIANGSTFFAGKPTTEQLMQTGRVYFDSISNEWGVTPVYPDLVKAMNQPSRRQSLEALIQTEAEHPIEHFYHAHANASVKSESLDPAMELIEAIADVAKQEAMQIAYQWAQNRMKDGKKIDKAAFVERARKERKSDYLKDNRDEIWSEFQGLI